MIVLITSETDSVPYPDRMTDRRGFDTPQAAAIAEWVHTPAAGARVVEVRPAESESVVWVVLQLGEPTGFHDQDIVTCVRDGEGMWTTIGSTGASSQ
jgi:hypothetical protein